MNDVAKSQASQGPGAPIPNEPDAHGQAALLLAESILHALVEVKSLSNEQALSVIRTTCDVKAEVATAAGESNARMKESLNLLNVIFASFSTDADMPATPFQR